MTQTQLAKLIDDAILAGDLQPIWRRAAKSRSFLRAVNRAARLTPAQEDDDSDK